MKPLMMTLAVLPMLALSSFAVAQDNADAVLGRWNDADNKAVFEIYEEGDKYYGRIVSLKEEVYPEGDPEAGVTKHDRHNPDESLRDRPIVGLVFLKDFTADGNGKYSGGTIYDPENGKTYKCKMTLDGDQLKVRGFIGVSLLGRTEVWTRAKE